MTLTAVYEALVPSVVALISKYKKTRVGVSPLAPPIFGTGFLVHEDGIVATNRHVAEVFERIPPHPRTGEAGYGAILFVYSADNSGRPYVGWLIADVHGYTTLGDFSADSPWVGENVPDIAFLQLALRETPYLKLATEDFYVRPGTPIATAGFPMGDLPLTVMGKVNQMTPFVRRGIVSSVFPFSINRPHGFTIDIMQQGGSSGSPIFYEDDPRAVGMMASGMVQPSQVQIGSATFIISQPTNISIAIPAHLIAAALDSFRATYRIDTSSFPTLREWQEEKTAVPNLGWDVVDLAGSAST